MTPAILPSRLHAAPFKIGTTSMIFGKDVIKNARLLAGRVDHIEIILFQTGSLDNIPSAGEIDDLNEIREKNTITYSVHLPAFLEIASNDRRKREVSIRDAGKLISRMDAIKPVHYVLHIPFTAPTLVSKPGMYFYRHQGQQFYEWTPRALHSLKALREKTGQGTRLLVENINYSPSFLEPFVSNELCGLCLDLGHLLLGQEKVMDSLKCYLGITEEVHLHGVSKHQEHLSLSVLPQERVSKWVRFLWQFGYEGIVNLEVFSPGDLEESLNILSESIKGVPLNR